MSFNSGAYLGSHSTVSQCARAASAAREKLAGVDRTIVLDQRHRLDGLAGPGTIKAIQLLEMGDKVAATLRRTGMHDESALDVIK